MWEEMWGGGRGVENGGKIGNTRAGGFLSSFLGGHRQRHELQWEAAGSAVSACGKDPPHPESCCCWETGRGVLGTEMRTFPITAYRLRRRPSLNIRMIFISRTQPQKGGGQSLGVFPSRADGWGGLPACTRGS